MAISRSLVAIVMGYAVMVAGAWFAQDTVFPGREIGEAPAYMLIAIGFATAVLGGLGGAVTVLLAPSRPFLHLIPMGLLITAETITLYVSGKVHGPLWFELLAGASLIAGTVVVGWTALQLKAWLRIGQNRSLV
jgi:hypothetical protein